LAIFSTLRQRGNEARAFLYAFDLLELNGDDLRREPIEVRKATLASILRKSRPGVRLNEHLEHPEGHVVFRWDWRGLSRSGWDRATGPGGRLTGSSSRTRRRQR
jgi:ATP dependent DNA ligase domain